MFFQTSSPAGLGNATGFHAWMRREDHRNASPRHLPSFGDALDCLCSPTIVTSKQQAEKPLVIAGAEKWTHYLLDTSSKFVPTRNEKHVLPVADIHISDTPMNEPHTPQHRHQINTVGSHAQNRIRHFKDKHPTRIASTVPRPPLLYHINNSPLYNAKDHISPPQ